MCSGAQVNALRCRSGSEVGLRSVVWYGGTAVTQAKFEFDRAAIQIE